MTYRSKKLRQGVDLTRPNYYLITLNTYKKFPLFGGVTKGKVLLSPAGLIADELWKRVPEIYPFTKIFEHVIMPDHIHLLLQIKEKQKNVKSVSHIIGYYKQQVTKSVLKLNDPDNPTMIWQRSFWARGFWKEDELLAYERYIRNNPKNESAPFRDDFEQN